MNEMQNKSNLFQSGADFSLAPLKVTLLSGIGVMHSLELPEKSEARYQFRLDMLGEKDIPLYLDFEDGVWYANAGQSGYFTCSLTNEKIFSSLNRIALADQLFAKLSYKNDITEYALYVEQDRPGDNTFCPYFVEDETNLTIGRRIDRDIYYQNSATSRDHAVLTKRGESWELCDNSLNGTYVNGRRVSIVNGKRKAFLKNGDRIFIMGLRILIGPGYLLLNNENHRAQLNAFKIRPIKDKNEIRFLPASTEEQKELMYDRSPRKQLLRKPDKIEIEMPPMSLASNKVSSWLQLGNPALMGGRAVLTGNYFSALTSLVLPALTQGLTEKDRAEYEKKRITEYRQYLLNKEMELEQEQKAEQTALNQLYPELNQSLTLASVRERLWERQKKDQDFLNVRVGHGQVQLLAELEYPKRKFKIESDALEEEMYALAEKEFSVDNAPIMLDLKKNFVIGITGNEMYTLRLLRDIAMQIAATHSYDEVKMVFLLDPSAEELFDFAKYIPHCWNNDRNIRFFATSKNSAQKIGEYLHGELGCVQRGANERQVPPDLCSYVVFAHSKALFESMEIWKEFLTQDKYRHVSILSSFEGVPKECTAIIRADRDYCLTELADADTVEQHFRLDHIRDTSLRERAMRTIMQTTVRLGNASGFDLPGMLTFLEMFGASRVEHLNPLSRWKENDPVQSLAAPLGVGTDGRLLYLDLHEKRQGPHGLVAGMTGSGKSELIITYILSMAVNYSPDEVAFILIDYKGGGLADAFVDPKRGIHLPHVVGTITNLDGAAIQRSLMSINSELKRRQEVFKQAKSMVNEGTLDIYDYQRLYRAGKVSDPLPHLFIVSDEFAELKSQQPEFMEELISAARIGRSLGVHLILATQKPSGVVNDQIWSNTKFRICLKVQDRGDSMEMLKRPEAAELKNTGRFYLQVGYNEYFALGQSAWCGAKYYPGADAAAQEDHSIQFLDQVGQEMLTVRPKVQARRAEGKQVVAIVRYLSDLAVREGISPRSLWMEPLPAKIELETALAENPLGERNGIVAFIGIADDPEKQKRLPFSIDLAAIHNLLLVGMNGSGKSTWLKTMLFSLISRYSTEKVNYYILDISNGALREYQNVPHCGAYLTEKDGNAFDRLMELIAGIIRERKELFAAAGVGDYKDYCQMNTIPLIVVIVDSFHLIKLLPDGDGLFLKFQDYLRDGAAFGIRYVFSCNHVNEVGSKNKQEIDCVVSLQAKDRYEYADILQFASSFKLAVPTLNGRGVCVMDGRALCYHTAMLDCSLSAQEQSRRLRERLAEITEQNKSLRPARVLPMVNRDEEYSDFIRNFAEGRIPLGYSQKDMKGVALPLQQLHSMSLYFGNPDGVLPVFQNLAHAADYNHMELLIVRKSSDSVFDVAEKERLRADLTDRCSFFNCDEADLSRLSDRIMGEIKARNLIRDEHSVLNGIPLEEKGRSKKAKKYIRERTTPILVLIESFADFCAVCSSDDLQGHFSVFFGRMFGYNIYFAAGFYHTDAVELSSQPLMKDFNREELLLLFGGRYDRVRAAILPHQLTSMESINPRYNLFVMKYRETFYPMAMPCGSLRKNQTDPDEEAIL